MLLRASSLWNSLFIREPLEFCFHEPGREAQGVSSKGIDICLLLNPSGRIESVEFLRHSSILGETYRPTTISLY